VSLKELLCIIKQTEIKVIIPAFFLQPAWENVTVFANTGGLQDLGS